MDYRIEQLRYLLREDPSSRIFYQLGELLRREGEAEEAVEVLRSGLERHPRYVSAWVCLGRSQRDLRALEEAEQAYQTALDLDRENPVAARLLGEIAVEREDWLGAVKALKLARALAGADDELDAQIAMVEDRLESDGRLDRPIELPQPVTPQVRCLEVVNLSADDPFSDTSEETEAPADMDDVFATTEVSEDRIADEDAVVDEISREAEATIEVEPAVDEIQESIPVAESGRADESMAEEIRTIEDAVTTEISATEPEPGKDDEDEFVTREPEIADDPGEASAHGVPIIDESSVGAWSTSMSAAGASGEEAWAEPASEIAADDAVPLDDPWAEPGAASATVETATEEPQVAADVHDEVETTLDEEQPPEEDRTGFSDGVEAETGDRPEDVDMEPAHEAEAAEDASDRVPPIAAHEFESIEATHPVVVEKRVADAEQKAFADADEKLVPDEAESESEKSVDESALPGEDRGFDAVEVTRPIPLSDHPMGDEMASGPEEVGTPAPMTEAGVDHPSRDDVETRDRRHDLEHGVPLPTMTLAKLALQQDDRPLAMATLESLIERDPGNTEAVAMLDELSALEKTSANERLRAARATTKIAALQGWLDAVRLAAERRVQ